jgi:hypothetical protein
MGINFDAFDAAALLVFVILIAATFIVVVWVGSLPGRIARFRGHPEAAAVTAAGWIGLLTLGILWPIAFVWAFLNPLSFSPKARGDLESHPESGEPLEQMRSRIDSLEAALRAFQSEKGPIT